MLSKDSLQFLEDLQAIQLIGFDKKDTRFKKRHHQLVADFLWYHETASPLRTTREKLHF
jgi:hypothetical protein